jgi:hypothetical protein
MSNPTLSGSNSASGAGSGEKALSVPQVPPIFSYSLKDGGDIYVYVFDTGVSMVAVMTLDDTASEVAYACRTILSANVGHNLVFDAIEEFDFQQDERNPFRELAQDKEAMQKLNDLLSKIFYDGE